MVSPESRSVEQNGAVTISQRLGERIEREFAESDRANVRKALNTIVSIGILSTPIERIQMAVVERSGGNLVELLRLVDVANRDWRNIIHKTEP